MTPERHSLQDLLAAARTQPPFLPKDDAYRTFRQRSLESSSPEAAFTYNSRTFILAGGAMAVIILVVLGYFTAFNQKADNTQIARPERKASIPAMALANDSTKAKSTHTPAVNNNPSHAKRSLRADSGSSYAAATSNRSETSATTTAIIPALNRVSNSLPVMFANCTPEQIEGYTLFDLDSTELSRLGLTVLSDGSIRERLDSDSNIMIWKDQGKGAARYTFPDIVLELHPNTYPSPSSTPADSIMTLEMPSFEFGSYLYSTTFDWSQADSTFKGTDYREFRFRVRGWKPPVNSFPRFSAYGAGDGTVTLRFPVAAFTSVFSGTNASRNSSSPVIVTNSKGKTYAHHTAMGSEATIDRDYRIPDFTKNTVENPVASKIIQLESGSYTLQDLVPIRIRIVKPPSEPDSVDYFIVYWYEPSQNLLDKLPERVHNNIQQDKELRRHRIEKSKFNDELPKPLTLEACVFPNPVTQDRATVHYSLPEAGRVAMALYDITGKRLRDFALCEDRREGNWEDQVSLHGIAPGLYVLAVTTDRGEQAIQKVVVQR